MDFNVLKKSIGSLDLSISLKAKLYAAEVCSIEDWVKLKMKYNKWYAYVKGIGVVSAAKIDKECLSVLNVDGQDLKEAYIKLATARVMSCGWAKKVNQDIDIETCVRIVIDVFGDARVVSGRHSFYLIDEIFMVADDQHSEGYLQFIEAKGKDVWTCKKSLEYMRKLYRECELMICAGIENHQGISIMDKLIERIDCDRSELLCAACPVKCKYRDVAEFTV